MKIGFLKDQTFIGKILNTINKMGCSITKPKSEDTIRTASMSRWTQVLDFLSNSKN